MTQDAPSPSDRPTIKSKPRHTAPPPERLAEMFPQLDILEQLGQGGMGVVYKARQRGLDRLVALKLLPTEASEQPGFAERFTREGRALAKLSHPNIVAVHDSGEIDGLYYFLMEYVDGPNLRDIVHAREASPDQALDIVAQVCEALQFAHDEGIIHRDIKPENVLLDTRGRVKIADFGLAKLLDRGPSDMTLTTVNQVMGTPHYMAPEQTERPHEVDHRADIYSVGVVLYEMITGELPLGRFPLPSEKDASFAGLDAIVLRTLEKQPDKRFQNASELRSAVETYSTAAGATPAVPASFANVAPAPPTNATRMSSLHFDVDFEHAYKRASAPGVWLFQAGLWTAIVHGVLLAIMLILFLAGKDREGIVGVLIAAGVGTACGILAAGAGNALRRLESRPLVILGCIAALLPLTACWIVFTLYVGIWAIMVANSREISAAFEVKRKELKAAGRGTLFAQIAWITAALVIALGPLIIVGILN